MQLSSLTRPRSQRPKEVTYARRPWATYRQPSSHQENRQATAAREFGDGIHRVGADIVAGTYVIGAQAEGQTCEWARLFRLDGTEGQVVEQGMWVENTSVVLGAGSVVATFAGTDR